MDGMIKFLLSIPQFGGNESGQAKNKGGKSWAWSKTALSRLSYYFKKVNYRRGHIVYREGDDCRHVYIVFDGEFELCKTVYFKEKEEEKFDHSKYLFKASNDPMVLESRSPSEVPKKIKKKLK